MAEELINTFENTITTQLRSLGVELFDDCGNRMKPGGADEQRVVSNIARNIVQIVVNEIECQTPVQGSDS